MPGPAPAATVAAVRRAWAAGLDVVVASPRPSAAPIVLRAATARSTGREIVRLGRRHGCDQVVLCVEPGWPERGWGRGQSDVRGQSGVRARSGVRSLAVALSSFRHAEVVVTGEMGGGWTGLAPLWGAAELVTAGSEEIGAALRAAGAPAVNVCDPYEGARLRSPSPGTVNPLEHGELLLRARGRRLLGAMARKMLGRREPAVRACLRRPLLWARRVRSTRAARGTTA